VRDPTRGTDVSCFGEPVPGLRVRRLEAREFPAVWFERYADDTVLHCVTERQAREVLAALTDRMAEVGLRLHPDKTRILYRKNGSRRGSFEHEAFTFLGYTFRPGETGLDTAGFSCRSSRQSARTL
jgi:hypothetical protein